MGKGWAYALPVAMAALLATIPHGNAKMSQSNGRIYVEVPAAAKVRPVHVKSRTLSQAVETTSMPAHSSRETECLAQTVYFEARGEGLEGQMAVARTVLNRTRSDLYPDSICAVVRQPSQFSFVHNSVIPEVDRGAPAWRTAVAIAHLARKGWPSRVGRALFFHASYSSPEWRLKRPALAQIGAHLFYA